MQYDSDWKLAKGHRVRDNTWHGLILSPLSPEPSDETLL